MTNAQIVNTTKKLSKGRWYYECKHESGTNFHLCGFTSGSNEVPDLDGVFAYPQGYNNSLRFYYYGFTVKEGTANYADMGFSGVDVAHTLGLAFDTYTRIFTVIYNYEAFQKLMYFYLA